MYGRRRIIALVLLSIVCFCIGKFNTELSNFFMNKDSLIGLLTVFICIILFRMVYLENKILRIRISHEHDSNKVFDLEQRDRNRKTYHQKLSEVKDEIIEEMNKLYSKVKPK